MSFDLLHPALQYHIVNSLGWRELRPFQEAAIPWILDGRHGVILAPTAGGKTEAAFFPVLSRMLSEGWAGLSVLYVCPIKALLNDLDARLQRYGSLVGRRSALWHGDITAHARRKVLRDPPDCLLTTPESLEVMLVSPEVDARNLFGKLHAVIVDEIHAFAGDDRGWHLLAVLERIERLAGREAQRLGLSATAGNPEALAEWLAGSRAQEWAVVRPPDDPDPAEVNIAPFGRAFLVPKLQLGNRGKEAPASCRQAGAWLISSQAGAWEPEKLPLRHPSENRSPEGRKMEIPAIKLDYVGSLENAAVVISRLHRGEKRLAFVDSRTRAEQLTQHLRRLGVTTFVTHSSLSHEQRKRAEEAFASREDCVIVATSVLELGVDVGDLDRVIQIDSSSTVSSFLQRMGRTGRRAGKARNCLILTTTEDMLVRAAALLDLWAAGYVEPITPPPKPWHILAQQLMALALQEQGIGRMDWWRWIGRVPGFSRLPREQVDRLVQWMLQQRILWDDQGILWLGRKGEEEYGRRNFLELFSVFTAPPRFGVRHGRRELGFVDATTFLDQRDGPRVLSLGGQGWLVQQIDWARRVAYVEATDLQGKSRWTGEGAALGFRLGQSIRHILSGRDERESWSQRARQQIERVRSELVWLGTDGTVVLFDPDGGATWWTFAGTRANSTLAQELSRATASRAIGDGLGIGFESGLSRAAIEQALSELRARDANEMHPSVDEVALKGLKFSACLPDDLAVDMLRTRLGDPAATQWALGQPVNFLSCPRSVR